MESRIVVFLLSSILLLGQSKPAVSQRDVVKQLLPGGSIPKEIRVKPAQRDSIVKKLQSARKSSDEELAQQGAFLLAALDEDYERNRDYLLHVMAGCNFPQIRNGCDDMTGFYLIYLWKHGHSEILALLIKTSIGSYNAAGSEGTSGFFAEVVEQSPDKFLEALSTLPVATQKKACGFAGSSGGGGLGAKGLALARKRLKEIDGELALRCLREIEQANRPDK